MALDLFDDVFGLDLALESPQGTLDGLTVLYSNLCQNYSLQTSPVEHLEVST